VTRAQQAERDKARADLRKLLPPGSVVYGCVRDVSRSGMSRIITFHVVERRADGPDWIRCVTGLVARALSMRVAEPRSFRGSWGMRVDGCGMDMVFHVVQSLSYALHGYGLDDDAPEQRRARMGRLARGASEEHEHRRPGYTLRSGAL